MTKYNSEFLEELQVCSSSRVMLMSTEIGGTDSAVFRGIIRTAISVYISENKGLIQDFAGLIV